MIPRFRNKQWIKSEAKRVKKSVLDHQKLSITRSNRVVLLLTGMFVVPAT